LAQLSGSALTIAAEVHEAVRLVDTKNPGWHPVGKSRSYPHSVQQIIHAISNTSGLSRMIYPRSLEHNSKAVYCAY
jgi:hypothetical protein